MKKIVHLSHRDTEMCCGYTDDGNTIVRDIEVGDLVILADNEYVGPSSCHVKYGTTRWWLVEYESHPNGIAGNCSGECELEGWRGTTDDWSTHAHGVWAIVDIGESHLWEEYPWPKWNLPGIRKVRVVLKKVKINKE